MFLFINRRKYYYWNTETDLVSWLPPGHPKCRVSRSAAHLRKQMMEERAERIKEEKDRKKESGEEEEDSSDEEEEKRKKRKLSISKEDVDSGHSSSVCYLIWKSLNFKKNICFLYLKVKK